MKMASRLIDLISKKNKFAHAAHFFFVISQKNKFARAARFFVFLCRCKSKCLGALLDFIVNFHHEHSIVPSSCPWVSEDVLGSATMKEYDIMIQRH